MTLPGDITTITVTGKYIDVKGDAAAGTVTFTPFSTLTDTAGEVTFTAEPIMLTLISGAFSVVLPCTDNSVQPAPFQYIVTVAVPWAAQEPFAISLPSTLGSTVDLSALSPIPVPASPVNGIYVISVNGQSGSAQVAPYNLPGTGAATRFAGATTGGHPVSGTFAAGDFVVDQTGVFWICVTSGSPGGWAEVGAGGGGGISPPAGDIGGSSVSPTVVATHLAAALPLAQGGTGQASAQAAMNALAQGVTSGRYLRGSGTNVVLAAIQAGDVPTLNQSTTGTAANITDTLDQVPAPVASVAMNGHKLTGLADGASGTDSVAFGQLGTAAFQASGAFDAAGAAAAAQAASDPAGSAAAAQANAETFATGLQPTTGTPLALSKGGTGLSESTSAALLAALGAAPLASPALSGTPTAPTASALTDSTVLASTAYADSAVAVETARAETAEALAYPAAGGTLTGALVPKVVTLTDAATVAITATAGNQFRLTCTTVVGASRALGTPSSPADGQQIVIDVIQPASGGPCTLTYSSAYDFGAGSAPALSTAASALDTLGFRYVALSGKWTMVGSALGFGS